MLAARLDLEDLEGHTEADAQAPLERIDQALSQTAVLLRSTVSELHPRFSRPRACPAR